MTHIPKIAIADLPPLPSSAPLLLPLPPSPTSVACAEPPTPSLLFSATLFVQFHPFPSAIPAYILPFCLSSLFFYSQRNYDTLPCMSVNGKRILKHREAVTSMIHFKLAARSLFHASPCEMSSALDDGSFVRLFHVSNLNVCQSCVFDQTLGRVKGNAPRRVINRVLKARFRICRWCFLS